MISRATRGDSIPERARQIALAFPEALALIEGERRWRYADLLADAEAMARALQAHGVGAGDTVVFALPRSADAALLHLAILMAGAVYAPFDPAAPPARWARQLATLDRAVVLATDPALIAVASGHRVIPWVLDAARDTHSLGQARQESTASDFPARDRDDAAAIMFTSGSTGHPKGVIVPHRGIIRLVDHAEYVQLGAGCRLLQAAPLAFDAATFEIWGAWLTGACLVVHAEAMPTAHGLGDAIRTHGITTMWLTAGLFNAIVDEAPTQLQGLRELLIGGEALSVPHVRRAQQHLPGATLINGYGPTETTTFAATWRIPHPLPQHVVTVPIGRAINATTLTVLDEDGCAVAPGEAGELWIGGDGVALGYIGDAELTARQFAPDPDQADGQRYRTGDRVRRNADGDLEYLGRTDAQLKISGHRIEPAEIEHVLQAHPAVAAAAVVPVARGDGLPVTLAAWIVCHGSSSREALVTSLIASLRALVRDQLPAAMQPAWYGVVPALPLTANGKVDRAALAREAGARAATTATASGATHGPVVTPRTVRDVEELLCATWTELLGVPVVPTDQVFDRGATSLLVVRATARLTAQHGLDVTPIAVYEHPTPRGLAQALFADTTATVSRSQRGSGGDTDTRRIAVVAAAVRFPGGVRDLDSYWQLMCGDRDGISRFTPAELDPEVPAAEREDASYVAARGVLPDVDLFDAGAFGIGRREAELMDPQQRLWLELAYEALDRAGLWAARRERVVGVYGGVYNSRYLERARTLRPDLVGQYGDFNAMLLNEKDYVTARVAHRLGLRGPAISVHSACSTSLVATGLAVQALRDGQCDVALAGGVSLTLPTRSGYRWQEGGMLSPDGLTRPFDREANGTVFSDGAAVLVLKRLADAEADGDDIIAVIRGVGINNDGAEKASFTAPSVRGQVDVITAALRDAGIEPEAVSLVEAHGTATPLGDPIEVDALRRVYGTERRAPASCRLGSVKGHLGHTVIAAGAAGLLKAALSLHRECVPGTLHFTAANPLLALDGGPFHVHATPEAWPRSANPRIAAVSSFGVGGTNAHLILEEVPAAARPASCSAAVDTPWPQVLVWSARSAEGCVAQQQALHTTVEQLAASSDATAQLTLDRLSYSLQTGRATHRHRRAVVARGVACDVAAVRAALDATPTCSGTVDDGATTSITMLIPGQGAQRRGMGRALYDAAPVFRAAFDDCARIARDAGVPDLRAAIDDGVTLENTAIAQPALFATAYAHAMLWQSWGVVPDQLIGHSVGEFVAATLGSVMSLEDAVSLVCQRGALMWSLPRGRMLAVPMTPESFHASFAERLAVAVDVAAVNGPGQCVVSGSDDTIAAVEALLSETGLEGRALSTSHAFHSVMMEPALEPFGNVVRQVTLSAPRIPIVSTVTGEPLGDRATDPAYWTRHLRVPVRFDRAIAHALSSDTTCLEVGPGSTLSTLARRQRRPNVRALASMGRPGEAELDDLATAAAQLWCWGHAVDFAGRRGGVRPVRVDVAPAPLDRHRVWVDATPGQPASLTPDSHPRVPSVPATLVSPASSASPIAAPPASPSAEVPAEAPSAPVALSPGVMIDRRERLGAQIAGVIEDVSGTPIAPTEWSASFQQLGLDSLALTQVALALSRRLGVKLTFRQLLEGTPSVDAVAEHVHQVLPQELEQPIAQPQPSSPALSPKPAVTGDQHHAIPSDLGALFAQQLAVMQQVMHQQLAVLGTAAPTMPSPAIAPSTPVGQTPHAATAEPTAPSVGPQRAIYDATKAFGAAARITVEKTATLTPKQRARLDAFVRRYTSRTAGSKRYTAEHRAGMADPRVVTGFRPLTKELVYPIVIERSLGARVWDVDGNEYIDVLCGFGSCLLGWTPPVVVEALREQLTRGFEVGPQHVLAGQVAERLRVMVHAERVALCNTGSEAVLGAIRVARTSTGRPLIAAFTGSYHGINDEAIVRAGRDGTARPAAPGIMSEATANVLLLDYGTPESLAILEARAGDIAAVLIEPVQSRRPDFQPVEYLRQVRDLCTRTGMLCIWDEIVTGFRAAPGGAQELFGITPDLSTFGKIVGGGMPIGVIAGKAEYMDALDGGPWQFGDDSAPTVGVTYFAGTFVRHPLALAAARATLDALAAAGPALQHTLTERTAALAQSINARAKALRVPLEVRHFASVWRPVFTADVPYPDLFFYGVRDRGIHLYEGFPCFLTAAHGDAECAAIVDAFAGAMEEGVASGFLPTIELRSGEPT